MSYLYGDSTPSTLEVNYIEFLRDAVDCCVQVLLADQRIAEGKARTRALEQATAAEIGQAAEGGRPGPEGVRRRVPRARPTPPRPAAWARSCARRPISCGRRRPRFARRSDAEVTRRDAEAAHEREACVKALEGLLIKHDLPDMTSDVHVALVGGGRYACRARVTTRFGLDADVELEVPAATCSSAWSASIAWPSGWTSRCPRWAVGCTRRSSCGRSTSRSTT